MKKIYKGKKKCEGVYGTFSFYLFIYYYYYYYCYYYYLLIYSFFLIRIENKENVRTLRPVFLEHRLICYLLFIIVFFIFPSE